MTAGRGRDRILHEALAARGDPLHRAVVFHIDHTNAMAYARAARQLAAGPASGEHERHEQGL